MAERSSRVVIIGGGIAGPALALGLRQRGIPAAIYEAHPGPDDIGGGLQIAPNGMAVLQELGLCDRIHANGTAVPTMRFHQHRGQVITQVRNYQTDADGQPAVLIARSVFHQILVEAVQQQGIEIHYQKQLTGVVDVPGEPIRAEFADGSTAEGSALVGADGVWSRTRQRVFPQSPDPEFTHLIGLGGFAPRSVLAEVNPPESGLLQMTFGPGGFFGYGLCESLPDLPVMWWSNLPQSEPLPRTAVAQPAIEDLRQRLLQVHQGWHDPIEAILQATPSILQHNIYDILTLPHWYRNRVVLIGDAAHAMSPSAGQGASVALEDAIVLAQGLHQSSHQSVVDYAQVFAQFERQRRERVEKIVAQGRQNGNLKQTRHPIGQWIRDRILAILLPLIAERSQGWMYDYRPRWTQKA